MKHITVFFAIITIVLFLFVPVNVYSHCDSFDGPVIKAAKKALETGNVNLVLIWVQLNDEAAIKEAFEKTLNVRKESQAAKELADYFFYETLVRIHRAGEDAPYTGLKPAGSEVEPGIKAADEALEQGISNELLTNLTLALRTYVTQSFLEVVEKKNYAQNDVKAGREYVKAYVEFVHYIKGIGKALTKTGNHDHESNHPKTE
jgi:hypothetical protein